MVVESQDFPPLEQFGMELRLESRVCWLSLEDLLCCCSPELTLAAHVCLGEAAFDGVVRQVEFGSFGSTSGRQCLARLVLK